MKSGRSFVLSWMVVIGSLWIAPHAGADVTSSAVVAQLSATQTGDEPLSSKPTTNVPESHGAGALEQGDLVSESVEHNNSCARSNHLAAVDPDIPDAAAPILTITQLKRQIGATRGTLLVKTDIPADEITVRADPAAGAPDHRHKDASASDTQEAILELAGMSPDTHYDYTVVVSMSQSETRPSRIRKIASGTSATVVPVTLPDQIQTATDVAVMPPPSKCRNVDPLTSDVVPLHQKAGLPASGDLAVHHRETATGTRNAVRGDTYPMSVDI